MKHITEEPWSSVWNQTEDAAFEQSPVPPSMVSTILLWSCKFKLNKVKYNLSQMYWTHFKCSEQSTFEQHWAKDGSFPSLYKIWLKISKL